MSNIQISKNVILRKLKLADDKEALPEYGNGLLEGLLMVVKNRNELAVLRLLHGKPAIGTATTVKLFNLIEKSKSDFRLRMMVDGTIYDMFFDIV